MRLQITTGLLAIILLGSCQRVSNEDVRLENNPFFSLKEYFQTEAARLSQLNPSILKRVTINEKVEEHQLDSINFERDFATFSASDINRKSWVDKYSIDSIFKENILRELQYTAQEESLKTRSISIYFQGTQVEKIIIKNLMESYIADIDQEMVYSPKSGYQLLNKQDIISGSDKNVKVEVIW